VGAQGWEETASCWAGLYHRRLHAGDNWLRDANPELAARAVLESGGIRPLKPSSSLQPRWLPRLTDLRYDPEAQARSGYRRGIGRLRLDNRPVWACAGRTAEDGVVRSARRAVPHGWRLGRL